MGISSKDFLFQAPVAIFQVKLWYINFDNGQAFARKHCIDRCMQLLENEKLYTTYLYERVELLFFRVICQLEKDVFQLFNNCFG